MQMPLQASEVLMVFVEYGFRIRLTIKQKKRDDDFMN